MNNIIKHVLILCIFSILSCKEKQNTAKINSLKEIINNNLGNKLKIPDSLEVYYPFHSSKGNKEILNSQLTIYSHVDASCGTCVENLIAWNDLIPELIKKKVKVNLICSSDDEFELLKYYFESKEINEFSHHLFLDHKNQYMNKNKFMFENQNFETVLIDDNNNEILLIGNPVFLERTKKMYFSKIEEYLK